MEKIRRIFLCIILMLAFFGFGGQKVLAASTMNNINNWNWGGTRLCWNNTDRKTVTFNIVGTSAEVSGFSTNGHTFMYLDAEAELNVVLNSGSCYKLGDPIPAASKMIFHTYSSDANKVLYPISDITLTPGVHTISCWGFADDATGGSGGCEFGLKPSCTLAANPTNLQIGDPSTLSWTTLETLTAKINPGAAVGPASISNGSVIVTPPLAGTNTYIMTVDGIVSSRTCQANIMVSQPTCNLTVSPSYVIYGDKTTLTWDTVGVTSAQIDNPGSTSGNSMTIDPSILTHGTIEVTPLTDTTYTMIATGKDGPVICNVVKVTVSAPLPKNKGLVPCARHVDDLTTTDINETQPCNICALLYMLKNIINFIMLLAIGLGIFVFVLIGLVYIFSGGSLDKISFARSAINSVISGIVIIFMVWAAIAIILQAIGYANVAVWNQVSCALPATPSQVLNLTLEQGNDMNTLRWDPPLINVGGLPILYYNVYCGTSPHPTEICSIGSPSGYNVIGTTFVHTGLENGKNYYYTVAAVNANGVGTMSNEVGTMFDCNASDPNTYQWKTVSTDTDYDRYGTTVAFSQCVGQETIIGGVKYYKNAAGNYVFIDAAGMLGSSDCDDANNKIWRIRYEDSDNDGYCKDNTPICVGDEPGYTENCGVCLIGGITDCNPFDNTRWCQRYYDHDGDGYGDASPDIFGGLSTFGLGPLFCVGNHAEYVDNNTDCDPNNFWIYQKKDVVYDKDQDGYTVIPTDPELVQECVGDSLKVTNTQSLTRTYYRNNIGVFEFVDSIDGSWLNKAGVTDCDPANVCIYRMVNVATDDDRDGYTSPDGNGLPSMRCVGDKQGSYYKNALCNYGLIQAGSQSGGYQSDCNDNWVNQGVLPQNINPGVFEGSGLCNNVDDDCNGVVDGMSRGCACCTQVCNGGTWYGCCDCPPPPASS